VKAWIDESERRAARRLNPTVYEYFSQGAGAELALREAEAAWDALRLRPSVLRDVADVDTATELFGVRLGTPVLAAPTALQNQADPEGEFATGRGLARAGSLLCVSSSAAIDYEQLAATGAPWWAQMYVLRDRALTKDLLQRLRPAGASAVLLTADAPLLGARRVKEPELISALPPGRVAYYGGVPVEASALKQDPALTEADIEWIAATSELPVLVKGVLRADDAVRAVRAGAAGVVVSNHGGRQLAAALPVARALPAVASAVAALDPAIPVLVDGGIRDGEHVLAALALGAKAVLLGRPVLWALASGGEQAVADLFTRITADLARAMALAGAPDLARIPPGLVERP
jgi:4-hydroxymandelate oxidase